jgi:hypothetical protein
MKSSHKKPATAGFLWLLSSASLTKAESGRAIDVTTSAIVVALKKWQSYLARTIFRLK